MPSRGSRRDDDRGIRGAVHRFRRSERSWVVFVREVLSSAAIVLLVGLVLFGVSGIWPPMVAVESGSMEPHMHRGDLVFLMEEHRLAPGFAHADTGVVTHRVGREVEYRKFGDYGDVIVFDPPGQDGSPIIHRAQFWVEDGEDWYRRANPEYVRAGGCAALSNCPAPHAGFITRGDANPTYDQASGISDPVRPAWISGTAEVRVPWLGHVRLGFADL